MNGVVLHKGGRQSRPGGLNLHEFVSKIVKELDFSDRFLDPEASLLQERQLV